MKFAFLFSVATVSALVVLSADAFAGRNNQEFGNPVFNNRFGTVAASQNLQEATDLKSDAQERADDADATIREDEFAGRSLFNSLLDRAESDMFAAGAGDTGSGNLNGEIYTWSVTATDRTFTLNGLDIFVVSCGAGGC